MDRYEKLQKVGEGAYGKVYKARDKNTGQVVAIKLEKHPNDDQEGIPPSSLREISILKWLSDYKYVVRVIDANYVVKNGQQHLYIVMEYLDTDLKKLIHSHRRSGIAHTLPQKITQFFQVLSGLCFLHWCFRVKSFMYQLCKAVVHCHSHGVIHRDLKPQNILVDKRKGLLKIADLGLARTFAVPMKSYTHEIASLWYRAPEVLLGSTHYSTLVDIWSVGCIFAEMVIGEALFSGDSEMQQLLYIFKLLGTPTEEMWPGIKSLKDWHIYPQWKPMNLASVVPDLSPSGLDLLSKMLQSNPARRISAKKALNHPYFDDLDKSQF